MDALLAIGTETRLLAEIKDIRDELNMIRMVLRSQTQVMGDFADQVAEELGGKRSIEAGEVRKKSKEQLKVIDGHIVNLDRMDKHATLIYDSVCWDASPRLQANGQTPVNPSSRPEAKARQRLRGALCPRAGRAASTTRFDPLPSPSYLRPLTSWI
jgi:hypothetical protein